MSGKVCPECVCCNIYRSGCGGQENLFFPEACPNSELYIGNLRWD